jgi:hypothetical protein
MNHIGQVYLALNLLTGWTRSEIRYSAVAGSEIKRG